MDPVTLRVPTLYGPGHYQTEALETFGEAVEEASGGVLEFEFYYQDSLVAPADTVGALSDGIVDLSLIVPGYNPSDFPIDQWTSEFTFLGDPEPVVGLLQSSAAALDWAFDQDDQMAEYEELGLVPLIPRFAGHDTYNLLCKSPITDLASAQGERGRSGAPNWSAEMESVGMVPVSLAGGEIYEGFQRGILDCHVGSGPDMADLGLWEVGKHYTSANFSGWSSGGLMMSETTWDSLPLAAQQILWDNAISYVVAWKQGWIEAMHRFVVEGKEMGLEFHEPESDFATALDEHKAEVLDTAADAAPSTVQDPEATVTAFEEAHAVWLPVVADELGYSTGSRTWEDWAESNGPEVDLSDWADDVEREILAPRRPE
ncbi:C4-dicarboxylate TRAP transporter substrate-binding protein [Aeromicrobium sp. CTD01-1L150]|uniref:C4-dicarboxylate TRAP transporter substrate-binding protein n=1 Tax=Aeromicrobium sp. CTD01-1L150 TaxID=3341830 RepID=UPI0035BFAC23